MKIILDKDSREEPRFLAVDGEVLLGAIQINRDMTHGAFVETDAGTFQLTELQSGDVVFVSTNTPPAEPADPVHDIPAEADDVNEMRIQIARLVERDLARKRKADRVDRRINNFAETLGAVLPELLKHFTTPPIAETGEPFNGPFSGESTQPVNAVVSYSSSDGIVDNMLDRWIMGVAMDYDGARVGEGNGGGKRHVAFAFPSGSMMSGFVEAVQREANPSDMSLEVEPER